MQYINLFSKLPETVNKKILFLLACFIISATAVNAQLFTEANNAAAFAEKEPAGAVSKFSLEKALEALTEKFNVQFGYKTELVKDLYTEDESWQMENALEPALSILLKPFDLKFKKINSKNYVIKNKTEGTDAKIYNNRATVNYEMDISTRGTEKKITGNNSLTNERAIPVKGRVTNANGEGIGGVSVTVKGTNRGVTTDNTGLFSIDVDDENAVLIFSSVGFVTQEAKAGSKSISIVLALINSSLGEVVVVGYGTQKRGDLTGSVASVKSKDIANLPASSLATALQGKVAGAYISQIDGNPNSSSSIVIRGPLSINGGEPLYVVDGVPFQGTGFNFNTQDIESIDILKDASAAAIYGYSAAGGVILVKTKRGSAGKMTVGFNTSVGIRKVIGLPSTLRRDEYITAKKAFGFNVVDLYGPESGWAALPNTNWFDEVYRTGVEQNHTLFLSGGSDKSKFYISGNYGKVEGTRIGNFVERFTFRVNSEHKLGKRFKLGQTFYGSFTKEDPNNSPNQGDLTFRNTPVMNVYDSTNPIGGWGKTPRGFQGRNDVQGALGNYMRNEGYEALLTINFDAEIFKGLVFRTVVGTGLGGSNNFYDYFKADIGSEITQPEFGKYLSKNQSFIATYTLNYTKSFGEHTINALAGYEARKSTFTDLSGTNRNPLVRIPQDFSLVESVASATVNGRSANVYDRVLSQFGRIEYGYKNKYLVTGTIRRDGLASKFGPNNRYGVFPGVSAGWKISSEDFMAKFKQISYLKFRIGYGLLGNSVGSDFAYSQAYGTGYSADFGGGRLNSVNIINRLPNPDIKWESVATTNAGVDIGLFNDKISVNLDYYNRQTKNMIYNVGIAQSAGLGGSVPANIGQMNNKGFEFNIEFKNKIKNYFTYAIGFNGATNKNRLISLDPALGKLFLTNGNLTEAQNNASTSRSEPGRELGNFYGYEVVGIYQNDAGGGSKRPSINGGYIPVAGDLIYRDINGDGEINADDRTYIGSPWPKLTCGFSLKLGWKNIDLSAFFNGVAGASIYNGFDTYQHIFFSDYTTTSKIFQSSGFNGQGVTGVPRVGTLENYDKNLNWISVNSYHVQKASYLRLRNLQVGYNLPADLLKRFHISSFRVFAMGDNLFTVTKYKGINPDLGTGSFLDRGIDNSNRRYPVSRIFSLGINAEF
jgi:TonB-dependent starch-binding outer membrane protein SusC